MRKVKLSGNGQLLIPKKIRDRLDLRRGDVLSVEGILLRPSKKNILDLGGKLNSEGLKPKSDDEIRRGIEEGATRRFLQ